MPELQANALVLGNYETPADAPRYDDHKALVLQKANIVQNGTIDGNATVDLVLTDTEGNKYAAITTGNLMKAIVAGIKN